jgi:hypothetical protein
MNFHPSIVSLLKFQDGKALCPFCYVKFDLEVEDRTMCTGCTSSPIIFENRLSYILVIKKNLKCFVEADFEKDQTRFLFLGISIPNLTIPHTKLPIFDIKAMQFKIKRLLPFI